MLVLTRQIGETIAIGDHITVTVLSVNGLQVRLGTAAPKDVLVLREELLEEASAQPARSYLPEPTLLTNIASQARYSLPRRG